ncbi:Transcriptional protein SWT1 [Collichthys lucidus]|uniref:Transcriptional protein SWT1 n=1 Tax=Collichthys lucidus TaxID=240159 RepID=A0A4U5TWV5_COLLU|nr:Transcriptional protein SWT1 [Collichthys lucidus]
MGKKSKRRKRKKSSSSEEDEETYKERDVTTKRKSAKREQDIKSPERGATKEERSARPTVKDDSQSTRRIKKPVYSLAKTKATDQKPVDKEEECTKRKSVSVPLHGVTYSSKTKTDISGKHYSVSETVERKSSKSLNTNNADTVPHRTEMCKSSLNEKSSHRSPSKSKKELVSPSLVSAEQKEQAHNVLETKGTAEEPRRTENYNNTIKTREPSKAPSVSKDSAQQKTNGLLKKMNRCSKNVTSVPGNVTSVSHKPNKSLSAQEEISSIALPRPLNFKIPKKVHPRPVYSTSEKNDAIATEKNLKYGTELSESGALMSKSKQETVQQTQSCLDVTPSSSSQGQDNSLSLSGQLPVTELLKDDQMQVVEELHLARSQKKLEPNVLESDGQLTCMDIDPPEEGADMHCEQPQQDLILVLDTNILLSHLDYVKKMRSHGLAGLGYPVILLPWVVLQEMDSLKKRKNLKGSVAHLAAPAISYVNNATSREPRLWGQSMQQAAEINNGLNAENNDDRVLQCCLQYQTLYPDNDKNLCSKALLSGVNALSKNDLEAEVERSRHGFHPLQNIKPHIRPQVSLPTLSMSYTSAQPQSEERTGLCGGLVEKDNKKLSKREDVEPKCLSTCISELEECLQQVLSDVLKVEMKAAFKDLWIEIVFLKPPWTLQDVLLCFEKHWIAVFKYIAPRKKKKAVLNLIDFFGSGKTVDCSTTLAALQEAKELVKVFGKRSRRVPRAISILDNIFNKLQPQGESPACDADDEDEQPVSARVPHQEVWALFENIWFNVCQIRSEVFKALSFDLHTMQSAQPVGGPSPPQDALVCLHKLSSMVSHLLHAFSSVLSSAPGLEEAQTLLNIIHSNEIANVDSRLTAKDLIDCFSQQDYREKLRAGGNKLMEMKATLDRCVGTTSQHIAFPTLS